MKKLLFALSVILLVFISGCIEETVQPEEKDEDIQFHDCDNDLNCFNQKTIDCQPASLKYADVNLEEELKVLGKSNDGQSCRVELSYLRHPLKNLSNKSMECEIPLGIAFTLDLGLDELCQGELKEELMEIGKEYVDERSVVSEFGAPCEAKTYWDNNVSKYELIGIEKNGQLLIEINDPYFEGEPEDKDVCHARYTLQYPGKTGKLTLDHYFDFYDEGFLIDYDNNQQAGPIQDWCQGKELGFHTENGYVSMKDLNLVENKYCVAQYLVSPSDVLNTIQVQTFTDNEGMTDVIIKTMMGTVIEKPFYRDGKPE